MNWTVFTAVVAAVGVPIAVIALLIQARAEGSRRAAEREQIKQDIYNRGYADGKASMQPTIDIISGHLADASRDRDQAQRRADDYEARYNNLIERRKDL